MSDIPGFVTWKAGDLLVAATKRFTHIAAVQEWDTTEWKRRCRLVADVFYALPWWRRVISSSVAQHLNRDGSSARGFGGFPRVSRFSEGKLFGRGFSYNDVVAGEWCVRVRHLSPDTIVHVNADDCRFLAYPTPSFSYDDINWAELELPVQPPQPACVFPC